MEKFVTAQFFIKSECVEEFKSLASTLIKSTREEEGNVFYQLYQSVEKPNDFLFYEIFKDQQSFDFHAGTPHFQNFVKAIENLTYKETEIKVII